MVISCWKSEEEAVNVFPFEVFWGLGSKVLLGPSSIQSYFEAPGGLVSSLSVGPKGSMRGVMLVNG
jgi:hypothetical protein